MRGKVRGISNRSRWLHVASAHELGHTRSATERESTDEMEPLELCSSRPQISQPRSGFRLWPAQAFPANKKENRGSPALCVSGNFQGKQRVFGAPFWKLAVFPESESWSGAKSEAKLRKSTKYPGGRRVISRYTRVLRKIPGILPIWPKIWLILGPNQPQTRLRAQNLTISTQFSPENREEKRGCCIEKKERKTDGVREANLGQPKLGP